MKARDRSTGNRDEEKGKEGTRNDRSAAIGKLRHAWHLDRGRHEDHTNPKQKYHA